MRKENVKYDCSHFQGHIPCKPNKQFDVQCDNCSYYENAPSAIVHLDTKQLLLNEIYKICNFEKREYVYETVDVEKSRTKEDNKDNKDESWEEIVGKKTWRGSEIIFGFPIKYSLLFASINLNPSSLNRSFKKLTSFILCIFKILS